MGTRRTCKKCKKDFRRDSSEIENVGERFHPIWRVWCPFCGEPDDADNGPMFKDGKIPPHINIIEDDE